MPPFPRRRQEKKVRRHNKNQIDKFFIFSRTKNINSLTENFLNDSLSEEDALSPILGFNFYFFPL